MVNTSLHEIPQTQPHLLTEKEVAQRLSVTARALQSWRLKGNGPKFVRISRTCVRYTQAALDEFVNARIKSSTSEA